MPVVVADLGLDREGEFEVPPGFREVARFAVDLAEVAEGLALPTAVADAPAQGR